MVTQIVKHDDNYFYLNSNRKVSGDKAAIEAKIASKQYELVKTEGYKPPSKKEKAKTDVFKSGDDYFYSSNRFAVRGAYDANKHNLVNAPADFQRKDKVVKAKPVYTNTNISDYDPELIARAAAKSDIKITRTAIAALKNDPKSKDQSIDELTSMFKNISLTSKAVKCKNDNIHFVRK